MARYETRCAETGTRDVYRRWTRRSGSADAQAHRLLKNANVVIYAGSLVPDEILRHAPPTAKLHNSASLTLEETSADDDRRSSAPANGSSGCNRVTRVLYSTIQEQMTLLDEAGIAFDIVPGDQLVSGGGRGAGDRVDLAGNGADGDSDPRRGKTVMPSANRWPRWLLIERRYAFSSARCWSTKCRPNC